MSTPASDPYARLVAQIDAQWRLLRHWPLTGGVSASVTALEVEGGDGRRQKWVVRRHGAADLSRNAQIAALEFRLLQLVHGAGLAVPEPIYLDRSCMLFPAPVLVTAYVEGEAAFTPGDLGSYLRQLAAFLARLHAITPATADLSFLPPGHRESGHRPADLDASMSEGEIRHALQTCAPLCRHNDPVLLHGDFWPGNVLWRNEKLAAVIDWEDAALDDPLADVANARLELLWAFDAPAMERFTEEYRSLTSTDFTHLPYWDLCSALRPVGKLETWGLEPSVEATMRIKHQHFVEQALSML